MNVVSDWKKCKYFWFAAIGILIIGVWYFLTAPSELLNEIIVYDYGGIVYLNNGLGTNEKIVYEQQEDSNYTFKIEYFHPTISPDNKSFVCLKSHGSYIGDWQVILTNILDLKQQVLLEGKRGWPEPVSFAWSKDGKRVYFLFINRLVSLDIETKKDQIVAEFPKASKMNSPADYLCYVRASQLNPDVIYALVPNGEPPAYIYRNNVYSIYRVNLVSQKVVTCPQS
jgi:hypothetical protein